MRVLVLFLMLCAGVPALAGVDVVVTFREGGSVDSKLKADELRLTAPFGKVVIEAAHLSSIDFGKGTEPDTVLTDDGTRLSGSLEGDLGDLLEPGKSGAAPTRDSIASLVVVRRAELRAGEITDGVARNGVSYHLRAPEGYAAPAAGADAPRLPAILILHGSNMNSRAYVNTIAGAWPDIAKRYLLIGINGENRNPNPGGREPTFNYTYVNFVGKSKFKGYPGTDRESPALVAEVVKELCGRLPIDKIFVGGHSQGGFLTYSLLMNEPELFAGAFPISAGVIFQCEPSAYDNAEQIAQQKRVPLVIVHARNDGVVSFDNGRYAWEIFEDAGFPMLRLETDDNAAHMFARLPVDRAIEWLELMSTDDADKLLDAGEKWLGDGHERDAAAALSRLAAMHLDDDARRADLDRRLREKAAEESKEIAAAMDAGGEPGAWVDSFLSYRARFGAAAAPELMKRYADLRAAQQELADDLFGQARQAYGSGDQQKGKELTQRIVKECFASDKYRLAKSWLDDK